MKAPDVIARLAGDGAEPLPPTSPAEFRESFGKTVAYWDKFFKAHPALTNLSR